MKDNKRRQNMNIIKLVLRTLCALVIIFIIGMITGIITNEMIIPIITGAGIGLGFYIIYNNKK